MVRDRSGYGALKAGSRATPTCEPRQDRKVAAVSGRWRVPRGYLTGATDPLSDRAVRGQRRVHGHLMFGGTGESEVAEEVALYRKYRPQSRSEEHTSELQSHSDLV